MEKGNVLSKKEKVIIIRLSIIFVILISILSFYSLNKDFIKKETSNQYAYNLDNQGNVPIFYGATKISFPIDSIEEFDYNDSRFRIFAKDYEDGDLTNKISVIGDVDSSTPGTYILTYKVTDSDNNEVTIDVPVTVSENQNAQVIIERTIYTLPNIKTNQENNDKQIMGISLKEGESLNARVISSIANITTNLLNNSNEISNTLPQDGTWITFTSLTDSIPMVSTPILSEQTITLEIAYDVKTSPLNYYHNKDDEKSFKDKWYRNNAPLGVIENNYVTIIANIKDYQNLSDRTLNQILDYYSALWNKTIDLLGFSLNNTESTNKITPQKSLIKSSQAFSINWLNLESFVKKLSLDELTSKIISYYISQDKNIYFSKDEYLGSLENIEEDINFNRQNSLFNEKTEIYALVNLLESFEKEYSLAKVNKWIRENKVNNIIDAYILCFAKNYQVNIIPYFKAWNLKVTSSIEDNIESGKYFELSILKDFVNESTLTTILEKENIKLKYSLVKNTIYQKYNITNDLILNINIDDFNRLKGKVLLIKDQDKIIKEIPITTKNIIISDMPIGIYSLNMPDMKPIKISIKETLNNIYEVTYQNTLSDKEIFEESNYAIEIWGNTEERIAYKLEFKNNFTKATISYPYETKLDVKTYIKIYDVNNNIIDEETAEKGYFDFSKGSHEIILEPGTIIEIYYPEKYTEKVKFVNSKVEETKLIDLEPVNAKTRYMVVNGGLIIESNNEPNKNIINKKIKSPRPVKQKNTSKESSIDSNISLTDQTEKNNTKEEGTIIGSDNISINETNNIADTTRLIKITIFSFLTFAIICLSILVKNKLDGM